MKLLLTSAGISNSSIRHALTELLGKPSNESSALFIPTALYPFSDGPGMAWRGANGLSATPLCEIGWKSVGVLELTALPSLTDDCWLPAVHTADAILIAGGDPLYLSHWMRQSGFADVLPSLRAEAILVGVSAGSMVLTPSFGGETYGGVRGAIQDDGGLGLVEFNVFPHLDHESFPENSMANAELWANKLPNPTYAIDDQTAIKVVDGTAEVISEGHWTLFNS